eukprot:515496_1
MPRSKPKRKKNNKSKNKSNRQKKYNNRSRKSNKGKRKNSKPHSIQSKHNKHNSMKNEIMHSLATKGFWSADANDVVEVIDLVYGDPDDDIPIAAQNDKENRNPHETTRLHFYPTIKQTTKSIKLHGTYQETLTRINALKQQCISRISHPFWHLFPYSYRTQPGQCKQFVIQGPQAVICDIIFQISKPNEIGFSLPSFIVALANVETQVEIIMNYPHYLDLLQSGQYGDYVHIEGVGPFVLGFGSLDAETICEAYKNNKEKDHLRLIQLTLFEQESTFCLPMEVSDSPIKYYDGICKEYGRSISRWFDVNRMTKKDERYLNLLNHVCEVSNGSKPWKNLYVPQLLCGREVFIPRDYVILDKGNKEYRWMIKHHAINSTPLFRVYIDEFCTRYDDAQILKHDKIKCYLSEICPLSSTILDQLMLFLY